jgi:saccharopine dehydrogenase-like NADP-dependent oxidoreductase
MDFLNSVGLLDSEPRKVGEVSIVPVEVLLSGVITEKGIETAKKAKTRDYGCTRLEIKGEISGQKMQYTADVLNSPYKNYGVAQHRTGIPAAIAVRMIRRGDITLKGCYPPDYGVDPKIYFKELARREIDFSYTVKYLI